MSQVCYKSRSNISLPKALAWKTQGGGAEEKLNSNTNRHTSERSNSIGNRAKKRKEKDQGRERDEVASQYGLNKLIQIEENNISY